MRPICTDQLDRVQSVRQCLHASPPCRWIRGQCVRPEHAYVDKVLLQMRLLLPQQTANCSNAFSQAGHSISVQQVLLPFDWIQHFRTLKHCPR